LLVCLAVACLLSLVLAAVYQASGREVTTVDAGRRMHALLPGEGYLPLGVGLTHYRWDGPEGGPVVVLVHGYLDTLRVWDSVVPVLTQSGFRVLRFDTIGHGLSDRLSTPYSRALARRQLGELFDHLRLTAPDLVGHSLGGAAAVDFTAHQPTRVRRLALLAPAVAVNLPRLRWVRVPVLGRFLARTVFLGEYEHKLRAREERGETWAGATLESYRYRGTEAALLSVVTGDGFSDYRAACDTVGRQRRRVLLVWGSGDRMVLGPAIRDARSALGDVEWLELEGAPHELPVDAAPQVARALVAFLGAADRW
jgi:pimeloyl-ACP methyl ester carboxylesterase